MSKGQTAVVAFALPDESRPFVRALGAAGTYRLGGAGPVLPTCIGHCGGKLTTVVHTGVGDTPGGRERLRMTLAAPEKVRWVVSAGYAGALSPDLRVGDLVLGDNHSDPGLLQSARDILANDAPRVGPLLTLPAAAETAAAKAALHAETGALAVDMETGWIASVCAWAGVPMLSLRVVSDAAAQDFPVPGRILFDAARQRPRYVALPLWLLARPARVGPFIGFVRGLGPARARLTRAITQLVARL